MTTPTEFMGRVTVTKDGAKWTLLVDGHPVRTSQEPADLRRALAERFVAEPRATKSGNQLKPYKTAHLPHRAQRTLFDSLDRLMRGEPALPNPGRAPGDGTARTRVRSDGLAIRHFGGTSAKQWWCRLCDSNHPPKSAQRRCSDMGEVFAAWDDHEVSSSHRAALRTASLVGQITDQISR